MKVNFREGLQWIPAFTITRMRVVLSKSEVFKIFFPHKIVSFLNSAFFAFFLTRSCKNSCAKVYCCTLFCAISLEKKIQFAYETQFLFLLLSVSNLEGCCLRSVAMPECLKILSFNAPRMRKCSTYSGAYYPQQIGIKSVLPRYEGEVRKVVVRRQGSKPSKVSSFFSKFIPFFLLHIPHIQKWSFLKK